VTEAEGRNQLAIIAAPAFAIAIDQLVALPFREELKLR
jgi:hypothetical protein